MKKVLLVLFICLLILSCSGDEPDNWAVGYWVQTSYPSEYTDVFYFANDGEFYLYNDYAATLLKEYGTWSLNETTLMINYEEYAIFSHTDNFMVLGFGPETGGGSIAYMYRKGFE